MKHPYHPQLQDETSNYVKAICTLGNKCRQNTHLSISILVYIRLNIEKDSLMSTCQAVTVAPEVKGFAVLKHFLEISRHIQIINIQIDYLKNAGQYNGRTSY